MRKINPRLLILILMAVFFAAALLYRIYLPYSHVFVGDWVKFASRDAYYEMRLVDNLVHNFPHLTRFDPFFTFPLGNVVGGVHFFDYLVSFVIWVIGLGSPSQRLADVIGAYYPTILAALTIIPVYFIGKALFNRWAGVIAAALTAILPGEFLGRTMLGYTRHNVAEILFSTVAVLFVILALKEAGRKGLTFSHLIRGNWPVVSRPLVYSLLAGVFLGLYLITWQGALLFVFIITLYFIVQFIIEHLRGESLDCLGIVGFVLFLVALIIYLPSSSGVVYSMPLVVALLIPPVLVALSRLISSRGLKTFYYPVTLAVAGAVFIGIFYAVAPSIFSSMMSNFTFVFNPVGATATTTLEMQKFLAPSGSFTTDIAWFNFTTGFFLTPGWAIPGFGLIAFVILIWLFTKQRSGENQLIWLRITAIIILAIGLSLLYSSAIVSLILFVAFAIILIWLAIKQSTDDKSFVLFLMWTLVILVATLVQRRFAYYFAVNIALLSAYISWEIIWWGGLKKLAARSEEAAGKEHHYQATTQKRDFYELLGIARGASDKEIKAAFRKLAAGYHPDSDSTPEAEGKFREINKAYEVLSNPERRAAYDRSKRQVSERKRAKSLKGSQGFSIYYINTALAIIMVFFLVFFWNIGKSKDVASQEVFAPSDAWQASLLWMKDNTPDPFGDPQAYYQLYEVPPPGQDFKYPASAYGVAAWWDYGYWITRIAHRLPNTNPSQNPKLTTQVSQLFLSQSDNLTQQKMAELEASYVILDSKTVTSKYWAVITWAGQLQDKYFGVYYYPQGSQLVPVQLCRPEYYRTLSVRLYNFDGKSVTAGTPVVVAYTDTVDRNGNSLKQITDVQNFSSYQEAVDYIASQKSGKFDIVGNNPFVSPIPLEAVPGFKEVYASKQTISYSQNGTAPEVKIFEFTK